MEQVYLEQGSQEWLEWRRGKRMASETAAVMGISPYSSPAQVRKEKQGRGSTFVTDAMQRGHDEEPRAREAYEAATGTLYQPGVFHDGDYGASVDGITLEGDQLLEIKTPAKGKESDRWQEVAEGAISEYDYAQVQHQMMVTGAADCVFLADRLAGRVAVVILRRDPAGRHQRIPTGIGERRAVTLRVMLRRWNVQGACRHGFAGLMDEYGLDVDAAFAFVSALHQRNALVVERIHYRLDASCEVNVSAAEVGVRGRFERRGKVPLRLDEGRRDLRAVLDLCHWIVFHYWLLLCLPRQYRVAPGRRPAGRFGYAIASFISSVRCSATSSQFTSAQHISRKSESSPAFGG